MNLRMQKRTSQTLTFVLFLRTFSSEDARLDPVLADSKNLPLFPWMMLLEFCSAQWVRETIFATSDRSTAIRQFCLKRRTDVASTIGVCDAMQVHIRCSCDQSFSPLKCTWNPKVGHPCSRTLTESTLSLVYYVKLDIHRIGKFFTRILYACAEV